MMPGARKQHPHERAAGRARIAARRADVARLLQKGHSYREIAAELDVAIGTVSNDARAVIGDWQASAIDHRQEQVILDQRRLDRGIQAIWDRYTNGDLAAINMMIRLLERRAKLLGLDGALKVELGGPGGLPIHPVPTLEEDRDWLLTVLRDPVLRDAAYVLTRRTGEADPRPAPAPAQ